MKLQQTVKLQMMNNRQFFTTLPNAIVKAKGWEKGNEIIVELDNKGNIVLKRKEEEG